MKTYMSNLTGEVIDGTKLGALYYFKKDDHITGLHHTLKDVVLLKTDGKGYQFEWNDLRALITVVNVILVMMFGYAIAWFGLAVAGLGCIKDLTEIPDGRFRFSSLVMHLANVALNIFFLVQLSLN